MNIKLNKNIIVYGAAFVAIIFLVLLTVIIRDTNSFSFKPLAVENSNAALQVVNQDAVTPIHLKNLPSCINSFTYLPSEGEKSCYVQFSCDKEAEIIINDAYISCEETDSQIYSCTDNGTGGSCQTLEQWQEIISDMCDCGN